MWCVTHRGANPDAFLHLACGSHAVDTPPRGLLLRNIEHSFPDIYDREVAVFISTGPCPQCVALLPRRYVIHQNRASIDSVDLLQWVVLRACECVLTTQEPRLRHNGHQLCWLERHHQNTIKSSHPTHTSIICSPSVEAGPLTLVQIM